MIETPTNKHSQTWTNDVLIPFVQNLMGGVAASCIAAVTTELLLAPSNEVVQNVALATGVFICGGFTVIRFFADDLGILGTAYHAGQQSQQSEINRLESMLYDAQQMIAQYESDPQIAIGTTRNNQQVLDAVADAEKLIRWAYEGQAISRAACGRRGMKQRAWERANESLTNAGIIRDGHWVHGEQTAALKALRSHYQRRAKQSQRSNVVTPY